MLFELSLTRVLSVLYFYHTAFLAISVAMLGLGAGALFVYAFPDFIGRWRRVALLASSVLMGLLPPLFFVVALELDDMRHFLSAGYLFSLFVTLTIIVLPFLGGGAVLALVFREHKDRVATLYAWDLLGAALAALALAPVMALLGGAGALFLSGVLVAVAAITLHREYVAGVAVALLMVSLAAVQAQVDLFPLKVDIGRPDHGDSLSVKVLAKKWNAFSRVVAIEHTGWDRGLSASRLAYHEDIMPKQIDALIDINAYAPMLEFDGDLSAVAFLGDLVSNMVYRLVEPGFDVAILGPGGGKDILGALVFEPNKITGIEINPILVEDFVQGQFREFAGDVYNHPQVRIIVGDGRFALARLDEKFDVIVANSVATWAAHSSGAMNLTESGLFTAEAFELYRNRLNENGLLSVSLWDEAEHSLPLRLIETWKAAGGFSGAPAESVAVIGNRWDDARWFTTVILSRQPFTPGQMNELRKSLEFLDFDTLYLPDDGLPLFVEYFFRPKAFKKSFPYDVDAATDDRPFFFYTMKFADAVSLWGTEIRSDNAAWFSLIGSLLVLGVLVTLLIGLPLLRLRGGSLERAELSWREMVFFCAVGAGFMLIEISLIQKLTLFLGHATYGLTVVLSGLLAWSGVGSFLASRLAGGGKADRNLRRVLGILLVVMALAWFFSPTPGQWASESSAFARIILVLLYLAPLGVLIGMPMPLALILVGRQSGAAIPWAWGLNGACGVLASVAAVIIAIVFGFTASFSTGWAFYGLALLVWGFRRPIFSARV